MKIQCDYCGNTYEDTQEKCPSCGAPNPSHQNTGKPKTIEELKDWYKKRNLPAPEVTRFFIGEDYKKPKAFGIYRDENGDFIVYKNKADGSRAIRYQGKDEQYAVGELYQRLKDEIVHQKESGKRGSASSDRSYKKRKESFTDKLVNLLATGWFIAIIVILISTFIVKPIKGIHNGYYQYDNYVLYKYQDDWFYWDYPSWYEVDRNDPIPQTISSDYDDYYLSRSWNSSIPSGDWDDSEYYDYYHTSSDSDYDSDYDWGSDDSWDSGGTDWDSDW